MNVTDRIQHSFGLPGISLSSAEQALYDHAGYRLAHFLDGRLVEFFDPLEFDDPVQALTEALRWMAGHQGETWLVLCSGFALCEPQRLISNEPATLTHLAEVIHQAFSDYRY